MASTPSTSRVRPATSNNASGPFLSPATSPYPNRRPPSRSQARSNWNQPSLSLRRVIGTTTSSPCGFDSLPSERTFALCAGSAAILAHLDDNLEISQRFFRARPQTNPVNPTVSFYSPSTPTGTPENRNRTVASLRDAGFGVSATGSPGADWGDNSSSKTWTARERVKSVTCVSLSPDGKYLAVGETGYNPRVLIFSTALDAASDIPLSVLMDHSFGVRAIAFSPNSQYLATLGNLNDGFLFIWSINAKNGSARLFSSNKCTSNVRHAAWMGTNLITVGTRHIKVWRVGDMAPISPNKIHRFNLESLATPTPSPLTPRALAGRNCILNSLIDDSFSCVAALSSEKAIVCSDKGQICLLDDTSGDQRLSVITHAGFSISSIAVDPPKNQAWIGGKSGQIQAIPFHNLTVSQSTPPSPSLHAATQESSLKVISMGIMSDHLISVDSDHSIKIHEIAIDEGRARIKSISRIMSAHQDSVLGVRPLQKPNKFEADLFTWSSGGLVRFWNIEGNDLGSFQVTVDQLQGNDDDIINELRVLRATAEADNFISGDKYGVVRLLNGVNGMAIADVRAHAGEITDISIHEKAGATLVATSGRDRMVQLFQKTTQGFDLVQTLDDHVGAVNGLLFLDDGDKLLSSSSDRTIIIRQRATREAAEESAVAYFCLRVITFKASPVSMTIVPQQPDLLIASTTDKQVQKYDITSGRHIHTFRASDPESNDSVVMDSLAVTRSGPSSGSNVLVGVASTDKSIRVYDYDTDILLTREFGHTEGVSDIMLIEPTQFGPCDASISHVVSTGLDGTIMIWDLSFKPPSPQEPPQPREKPEERSNTPQPTASRPPIRRILSRAEIASFQGPDDGADSPTPRAPTPRAQSPPRIRKRTSKHSLHAQAPKLNTNSPVPPLPSSRRSPTNTQPNLFTPAKTPAKSIRDRSPTPPSPRATVGNPKRRQPLAPRTRTKSASNISEFGSLNTSTEQVCRTLRAYRRKLHSASGDTDIKAKDELERELALTVRALERVGGGGGSSNGGNGRYRPALGAMSIGRRGFQRRAEPGVAVLERIMSGSHGSPPGGDGAGDPSTSSASSTSTNENSIGLNLKPLKRATTAPSRNSKSQSDGDDEMGERERNNSVVTVATTMTEGDGGVRVDAVGDG
ncbi:MAG: hypothetical protein M1834_002903 [Cirrosporium novae-zelandiae]|nr:MAG: hypothetical protein M1834_002903 [Cirrosporium novae-zelandiae]